MSARESQRSTPHDWAAAPTGLRLGSLLAALALVLASIAVGALSIERPVALALVGLATLASWALGSRIELARTLRQERARAEARRLEHEHKLSELSDAKQRSDAKGQE